MPYPSNSVGTDTIPNNFYDGKGYDDPTLIPQIIGWRLYLRDGAQSGLTSGQTNLHVCCYPNPMYFSKSVEFIGGFAFLGLAEMLKYIAGNTTERATQFIGSFGAAWGTASQIRALTYSTNTATNVDQFLNSLRTSAGHLGSFSSWSEAPIISINSRATDTAKLNDCIFGPGLPMHKENLSGPRYAYIDIRTEVQIEVRNIYLRGNTIITSAGIGTSGSIDSSNAYHYGTTIVAAPWTWRQFYHTFISSMGTNRLNFKMFGSLSYSVSKGDAGTVFPGAILDWYRDLTGKLLPNHIHLLTNSTTATAPNSFTSSTLAYPASTPTVDYDNGPFLDQFIHAKVGIVIDIGFTTVAAYNTLRPVWQGFLGRFGSNGHNATKTRGILIGNMWTDPEGGAEVTAGVYQSIRSIFVKAGVVDSNGTIAIPPYDLGTASYGEANPAGNNPVITVRDNGSTTVDLNLGLRTWRAGISPQYGSNIRPRNIIL
jgi:hypothetical protein